MKMKVQTWNVIVFLLLGTYTVCGQEIVSTQSLGTTNQLTLNALLVLAGSELRAQNDVELVKVTYTTTGIDGEDDVASGLFMIPSNVSQSVPLHCHQHGTTDGRDEVPSNRRGGYELGLFFATQGQFVIMPDYLGMGESRGFHPYVHRETQARAGVDMLFAAREYADGRDDLNITDQVIVAGYSQGGHAAMSLQQALETEYVDDFDLTVSTPMSGPYNLSGAFKRFIFGENEYFFPGYVLYQLIGYQQFYPDLFENIGDIIKEPYVAAAEDFAQTGRDLGMLQDELINTLIENEGASIPIRMFKDEFVMDFRDNPDNPLNLALLDNDTHNFTAKAPTRIIYCTADDQVPFRNSLVADSILNANGSTNVSSVDIAPTQDHGGCGVPAIEEAIRFMNQFLLSTSTEELSKELTAMRIYPNPTDGRMTINKGNYDTSIKYIRLYGSDGALMKTIRTSGLRGIDISDLPDGMYAMEIATDRGTKWERIIKQ